METEKTVKPLKYKELQGLSSKQLSEHHDVLYAGYVKKVNELRAKIPSADKSTANGTYAELRELKLEEGFAVNGVKLHESYFDNLGGNGQPDGDAKKMIEQDFGSYEKWEEEFKALGLCSRGWAVLAYDLDDKKLRNYIADVHNQGGVWNAIPLLVLDVYEHAYFLDYATGRKKYIEAFFQNMDWKHVNNLLKQYKVQELRK